jgi:hypothetical protein
MNGAPVSQGWKSELENTWLELGVPEFFAELGVDFEQNFLAPLLASTLEHNPYAGHQWSFFRLDRLPPGVLHASPLQKVGDAPALWEEWFIEGEELHHHSMRNSRVLPGESEPNASLLHWRSPLNDTEHPEEVMDVDWHYFNDADQRPYLLR